MKPEQISDNAEATINEQAVKVRNWGRWGTNDVLGTLNFITPEKRRNAATLVKKGISISCAMEFNNRGPQTGLHGRTNPLHTMLLTGLDDQSKLLPHGVGFADDVISMPLQAGTQWDGLGHCFDHGHAFNGRPMGIVTSFGDQVTGIETARSQIVSRGVLLDVGRAYGDEHGELEDGFAIKPEHLNGTIAKQGNITVGTGDLVLVRTGQMSRCKRLKAWGGYAGGDAPGISFTSIPWLHEKEIAGIATDTWGFECRPNEMPDAFQPVHQIVIPNMGLFIGEIWDLDALADSCAEDNVYEFMLVAAPIPFTGAVGGPVNPIALK
ncbi:arylformamidase [Synchytrium microbalum]|uniref:Arylformamidase n=1 Tax=Synchytrium microbalum TaxID=1806994 RepID=A0A507BZA7_9FUNG|nr:arylformamidase [Synchytrium microbalum]TPX32199.1 arylformamidase [Synchytrium microbalum]